MNAYGTGRPIGSAAFATTQWALILSAASDDEQNSREALAQLCRLYWIPLYVFVRRTGYSSHDAEDLIQGFFANLVGRGSVKRADPNRGRFRTFLLSSLKNFLRDERDRATADRRGGGTKELSFDVLEASDALVQVQGSELTPDQAFDRSWTLALLDHAMNRLRAEQEKLGKARWFEQVRPYLQAQNSSRGHEAIAAEFGMTRNAAAVAIHRLATRYRELVRAEIAETLCTSSDLQAEQRHLLQSITG